MSINWVRTSSDDEIVSDCGTYKVCKLRREQWLIYAAKKLIRPDFWITLWIYELPADAKTACEWDLVDAGHYQVKR